jgi:uncharacterized membrane protein
LCPEIDVGPGVTEVDGIRVVVHRSVAIHILTKRSGYMQHVLTTVIDYIVPVVEACGALVIVLEVVRTIVQYVLTFLGREHVETRHLRARLGHAMVTGLEFQVAADILKTALDPEWNDILLLAALIGLRTLLNFFLERELESLQGDAANG